MTASRRKGRVTKSWMIPSAGDCGSGRPRSSPVLTLGQLRVLHQGEHGLARHAHHRDGEPDPAVRAIVAVLVVDHITARLPKRFPGPDGSLWLPFQLEEHLPLHYVAEGRAGMSVWRSTRVAGGKLDEDRHHLGPLREGRRVRVL